MLLACCLLRLAPLLQLPSIRVEGDDRDLALGMRLALSYYEEEDIEQGVFRLGIALRLRLQCFALLLLLLLLLPALA
jgi:hypothetical protein